jgi:hypothetical protein
VLALSLGVLEDSRLALTCFLECRFGLDPRLTAGLLGVRPRRLEELCDQVLTPLVRREFCPGAVKLSLKLASDTLHLLFRVGVGALELLYQPLFTLPRLFELLREALEFLGHSPIGVGALTQGALEVADTGFQPGPVCVQLLVAHVQSSEQLLGGGPVIAADQPFWKAVE